jgi:hypothetical protein
MKLEDFVSDTIEEIIVGIKRAQDKLNARGIVAALNPIWKDEGFKDSNIQKIEFDVAITAATTKRSKKG